MTCDLIHDEHGWWMQYERNGKKRCRLLDCTDSLDAQLAAQELGYNVMTVWEGDRQVSEVQIPKDFKTKGLA